MYLLDTNQCSRAIIGDSNILHHIAEAENAQIATCVIVQGELTDMAERSQRRESNLALVRALSSRYLHL